MARPDGLAMRVAALALLLAALAGIVLIVVYWRGADTQYMGLLYFVGFGGIGVGLIVWANGVLRGGEEVEPREELAGSPTETTLVEEELAAGGEIERRSLLRRVLWLAGGAVGASLLVPIRSLGPSPGRALLRTGWSNGVRVMTRDGTVVLADEVPPDGLLTVFPENDLGAADGQVVLVRVEASLVRSAPGRESWTPGGLIAYSKVCTHAGCPVGLYQAETHRLLCPCHQSEFDVLDGAKPLTGPAAWPLPQLPLVVGDDGILRAGGPLSAPVGPGWWRA